ncbi:MAG: TraX family protein [Oscillospiraceae bacterium]
MKNKIALNGTNLKLIAIILMVTDHLGALIFPEITILRIIGRLAFPIFAFLICEGVEHTHNFKAFATNLLVFAVISEPFFDYAIYGKIFWGHQNIFFTLLVGVVTIHFCETQGTWIWGMIGMVVGEAIKADYGAFGVMLIVMLWYQRKEMWQLVCSVSTFAVGYCLFEVMGIFRFGITFSMILPCLYELWSLLAIPIICCYNGERGKMVGNPRITKYAFYAFYPLHFLILSIIGNII